MGDAEPRAAAAGPAALVQSVDRALSVLEILGRRGEAGVSEIALELGVHKSTAFRLLAVLESRSFVEQSADRGAYRLGVGIVRLAGATAARLELSTESAPACKQLAADLGETVTVAILDADCDLNISQVRGGASVASHNWVGQRTPAHATSSGKVLLAFADPGLVRDVLAAGLQRFTPATRTDPAALLEELERVRKRGWACTAEEYEVGLDAVAAPIRDASGEVVAAVSASGPAYRLRREDFERVAGQVLGAAAEISSRMGHFG